MKSRAAPPQSHFSSLSFQLLPKESAAFFPLPSSNQNSVMAPRKRTAVEPSSRVTRSSSRPLKPIPESPPPKKRAKKSPAKPKEKKVKSDPSDEKEAAEETKVVDGSKKTIVVEYCKQCKSFEKRAFAVKEGLEKGVDSGVNVVLNPEKPRRGCFEIREDVEGGEKFVSLLDLKRPFNPMKALDMEKVVSDIVDKIKG